MTKTQRQAVALAERVCDGCLDPSTLPDSDWYLLLLAAELNNAQSLPMLVCRRVLDRASRRVGFFGPRARGSPARSIDRHRPAPADADDNRAADGHAAPGRARVDAPGRRYA